MPDALLILNAGSSSVKFSVLAADASLAPVARGQVLGLASRAAFSAADADGRPCDAHTWPGALGHDDAADFVLSWCARHRQIGGRIAAAGHRVVHGGAAFDRPVRITPRVLEQLDALVPLAPLHQGHNLSAIRAVMRRAPDLPQVACFDTAFHRTQPEVAQALALPRRLTDTGLRRYGFHGLSYEHIASVLPGIDPAAARGRTIVAHLGHGASLCALRAGRSVATTMGFSALDGLVMSTRCGLLDPGVVLHLQRAHALTTDEVERVLYEESGLLGVSGLSADMRTLLESADPRACEAVDLFVYRAAREIGSLAAALGGLDALVFTGGIGEHGARVRDGVVRACAWLGAELDPQANDGHGPCISAPASRVRAWVIPADEERMIARHVRAMLSDSASTP